MVKRKPITKKLRFEVFKRDNFTCQYCGRKAPEVILEIDHILPVAKGGDNSIFNLITCCKECNSGKRARLLNDNQFLDKQVEQVKKLQERENELKLLQKWYQETQNIEDKELEAVNKYFTENTHFELSEYGRNFIKKLIKKFSLDIVFEAIKRCYDDYYYKNDDKSWEIAFKKIKSYANIINECRKNPYLKEALYLRKIIKNNLNFQNTKDITEYFSNLLNKGYNFNYLKNLCINIKTEEDFENMILLIERIEKNGNI